MKYQFVPQNFVYPEIKETDFRFGSNQIGKKVLNESGDWRLFLPPAEEQAKWGVESSACATESQQHALATIQEEEYGIQDTDYSARFNAQLSGTTPDGNSPIKVAESFRRDGLIPDKMLPFAEYLKSWYDYMSFKGADERSCRLVGKGWRKEWDPRFDIVITMHENIDVKYKKLREALKSSPLPVSVCAWFDEDGVYIKPEGMSDNHLTLLVHIDEEGYPTVFDTYAPFIKKLEKKYNFDFGMRWTLEKIEGGEVEEIGVFYKIINFFKNLWRK